MKYLVSHDGQEQGPISLEEISAKVRAKELELFDYIFDEAKGDWVLLMEFPQLAAKLKTAKPARPVKAPAPAAPEKKAKISTQDAHAITEWFVMKGENRFGPFTFVDLVKMTQQKVLFPFDFVWHAGLENWRRMAEIEEFTPENMRSVFEKNSKNGDMFHERQFNRKPFAGNVIVHDNLSLWKAQGFEISRGGVGVSMSNSLVIPGQQVNVHFKKFEDWPAFNAVCEVVSKKFVKDQGEVQYGLRFLSMTQDVREQFYKRVK